MIQQRRSAATAMVLLLLAGSALAQDAEHPWARGVPAAKQAKALALFNEGNAALKESFFLKAAQLYREALASWDHPAIHYNLGLALVNLGNSGEAHDHLVAALKYGARPLGADKYAEALRTKVQAEKELVKVEIRCAVSGALVKLDGVALFFGPGAYAGMVRAGRHTVLATKQGAPPNEQTEVLAGGTSRVFDLKLLTADDLTFYRRRWSGWIPVAVVGAGAVLGGIGAGLHLTARDQFRAYDEGIRTCGLKPATAGCVPSPALAATRQRGDTLQALAITSYAVGGAALLTGLVLLYANRLQPFVLAVDAAGPRITVAPLLGPNPGAAVFVSF